MSEGLRESLELKAFLQSLCVLCVLLALGGAIIIGARLLPVPITDTDHQSCLSRAQAERTSSQDCPRTETLWDRGLRDPVAYYTLWLTFFTLALAIGAAAQSVLIGRQIALSREEFISTFRPHLIVRNVH